MKHRSFKNITNKISELATHDTGKWTRGCELYMYGNKGISTWTTRRTKQCIMRVSKDGLHLYHIYSSVTNEFGLNDHVTTDSVRSTVLKITGIDMV